MAKKATSFFHRHLFSILVIVIVVLVVLSAFLYRKTVTANRSAASEIEKLVSHVGDFVLLPQGETPTLATVSNLEALKDQPFFADALEGDKVLIYTNAKKAVLYRPSTEKVINIAPLNVNAAAQ